MIQKRFQNIQSSELEIPSAYTRAREKIALNQLNGFVGSTGCRVHLLGNMDGLRQVAARMFGVTDDESPEHLASRIDALGRDARRAAAQAFVARHHPLPNDLFPADARARRSTPLRPKRPDQATRTMPALIQGEAHSRQLDAAATRFLQRHPETPKPLPPKVVEPVVPPMKKAKRRKLMSREAQRKQAAGIPLSKAEQWEIDRRARQKVFRTDKRHRRAAQRALEVTVAASAGIST